eukprot:COSAG04_NODE_3240_length_3016_cov_1.415153_7_plen_51_part_01
MAARYTAGSAYFFASGLAPSAASCSIAAASPWYAASQSCRSRTLSSMRETN